MQNKQHYIQGRDDKLRASLKQGIFFLLKTRIN